MKLITVRSCPSATVLVGKNCRGDWVVLHKNGTFGGLFVSRAQAFKYALSENGHRSQAIVEVSQELELDIPVDCEFAIEVS